MSQDPRIEAVAKALNDLEYYQPWDTSTAIRRSQLMRDATAAVAAIDKAATITTVEGLATLPEGTVIIDKHGDVNQLRGEFWCGHECSPLRTRIMGKYLPARVIHWGTE